jgi:cell division septation protein DedD
VLKVKERLTGAIILVALIVLLVPELLTGPIRATTRAAAASSAEEPPLRSYTINLSEDARARSAAQATSGPAPPTPLPPTAAADPPATAAAPAAAPSAVATPAQPEPPERGTAAPAAGSAAAAPGAGAKSAPLTAGAGWVVQLGSFVSHANAAHLARQVHAQGFAASVSQGSGGRRLYRVRVGPVADRPAAAQLAQRLRAAGHNGAIVPQ